jgi:hypothetical protein
MTKEEKENILDKHKEVYDGYVTNYIQPNTHPIFVQSYANDKKGITVNNKGEVGEYRNMGINEDIYSGAKFEPEETFEQDDYYVSAGKRDMIADRHEDMEHGTFDGESGTLFDICVACRGFGFDDVTGLNCEKCNGTGSSDIAHGEESCHTCGQHDDFEDLDLEDKEIFISEIAKTKDMFNRFKNY